MLRERDSELKGFEALMNGDRLPSWVIDRLREKRRRGTYVPVNYWERMEARKPAIMRKLRYWINDADEESKDTCGTFTQAWLTPEQAKMSKDLARLLGTSRPDEWNMPSVSGIGVFRSNAAGPPVSVHGGAIATMFDTHLGQTNMLNLTPGMTGSLTVHYRKRVPLTQCTVVALEARVDRMEGRKIFLSGEMIDGSNGTILATCTGLWIRRREQQLGSDSSSKSTTKILELIQEINSKPSILQRLRSSQIVPCRTNTGHHLILSKNSGWILDNARSKMPQSGPKLLKYMSDSNRLTIDYVWNSNLKQFIAVFAFSRQCMGPPCMTQGGCLFACLDQAITSFLYTRAASDLGAKGGLCLTSKMTVNYRVPVPLESEYVVVVSMHDSIVDRKGRTRFKVQAKLYESSVSSLSSSKSLPIKGPCRTEGIAEFVQTNLPWPGQSLGTRSSL